MVTLERKDVLYDTLDFQSKKVNRTVIDILERAGMHHPIPECTIE